MMVKWVLINRATHLVKTVIHSADSFIDDFIKETFGEEFLCIRETEHTVVGPGWLYVSDGGYTAHHYEMPPRKGPMAMEVMNREPKNKGLKIEAVITCVNYADYLRHTLVENLHYLDNVVVVTTPQDKETIALCKRFSVDCIDTEVFYDDGDKFNKGRGINLGLAHLRHDDWLIHMDADTVLPHRFRDMLARAKLKENCLYGADRINVRGFDNWQKLRHQIEPHYEYNFLVNPPISALFGINRSETPKSLDIISTSGRPIHKEYGYVPIGYFQMWHSSQGRKYPINQGAADHTDVLFSVQWPRERRLLLPELFVYHLESEPAQLGANWKGRSTKRFEPKKT